MDERNRWIIFDADNTLWAVEGLYDDAREVFCEFLASKNVDPANARQFQQQRDKMLHDTYGYSACRFARSFEDTLLHFLPDSPAAEVRHVRRVAFEVFERPATPVEGLAQLLDALAHADYRLGIITAGENWVQQRRLSHFPFSDRFHAIEIVDSKDQEVFRRFCEKNGVRRADSWVAGDSLRSDVVPAKAAGLNAVLLQTKNWNIVEAQSEQLPPGTPVIRRLEELLSVVGVGYSLNGAGNRSET